MTGAEFRRKIKRLEKQGVIKELYARGYLAYDINQDIALAEQYLTSHTYRSLAKFTSIPLPLLFKKVKRCL